METAKAPSKGAQRTGEVQCDAFRKGPDGTWVSVRVTDVQAPIGAIRIPSGMEFRRGRTLCGVDVASILDQECT